MSEDTKKKLLKKPSKRTLIIVGAVVVIGAALWASFSMGLFGGALGSKKVNFEQLGKDKIPKSIETEVIPEYREDIRLEKGKKGDNMQVHVLFKEPKEGEAVSQIITYPYSVAETDLTKLPSTIELIVKYEE